MTSLPDNDCRCRRRMRRRRRRRWWWWRNANEARDKGELLKGKIM